MRYFFLIFFIAFLTGCQKYSEIEFQERMTILNYNNLKVEEVKAVNWPVGLLRNKKISKGMRIQLNFPRIKKEDFQKLIERYEVDSWLIRVKRSTLATSEILEYTKVPLISPGTKSTDKFRFKQVNSGFISIYYAAAAISTRLEKLACPAMGHRKLIESINLKEALQVNKKQTLSSVEGHSVLSKVVPFSYSPIVINGGKSLVGNYHFDIALYDSVKKQRIGDFVIYPEYIKIDNEKEITVASCSSSPQEGPLPLNQVDKVKQFKFGR